MIKIIGICGSPREGATEYVLRQSLKGFEKRAEVEVEYIILKGKKIAPCNGCGYCRENKTSCIIEDDMNDLLEIFLTGDAFVVASPVYVFNATPQLGAFFSRMRSLFHMKKTPLRDTFGVAMAVGGTRNGGQEATVTTILNMMMARGINIISNETGGYSGAFIWSADQGAEGAKKDAVALEKGKNLVGKLVEITSCYKKGKK